MNLEFILLLSTGIYIRIIRALRIISSDFDVRKSGQFSTSNSGLSWYRKGTAVNCSLKY